MKKLFYLFSLFGIMLILCLANVYSSPLKTSSSYSPVVILDVLLCFKPVSGLFTCTPYHTEAAFLNYKNVNTLIPATKNIQGYVFFNSLKNLCNYGTKSHLLLWEIENNNTPSSVYSTVSAVIKTPNFGRKALYSNLDHNDNTIKNT